MNIIRVPQLLNGGSWASPSGRSRTEGVRARLPRRSVIESASSTAHIAKGRARRARRRVSLASWAGGADDSSERGSPLSVPAPPTASISANHTPSRHGPRGPRKSDGAPDVKSSGKKSSASAGVSLACGSRDRASGTTYSASLSAHLCNLGHSSRLRNSQVIAEDPQNGNIWECCGQ